MANNGAKAAKDGVVSIIDYLSRYGQNFGFILYKNRKDVDRCKHTV